MQLNIDFTHNIDLLFFYNDVKLLKTKLKLPPKIIPHDEIYDLLSQFIVLEDITAGSRNMSHFIKGQELGERNARGNNLDWFAKN